MNCNDKYLGKDKLYHFIICFICSCLFPPLGLSIGWLKEWADSLDDGNHWCWKDIIADMLGFICGTIVFLFMWRIV